MSACLDCGGHGGHFAHCVACRCATLPPGDDCPAHPFDPTQYRPALTVSERTMSGLRSELLAAICAALGEDPAEADPAEVDDLMAHLMPVIEADRERHAAARAAEEITEAAKELHVLRFNADADDESRWPAGTPRVVPDTFSRGITFAESALRFRAAALDGQAQP